jgi:hypothetical protein
MTNDFTTNMSTIQSQNSDNQVKSIIDKSINEQIIEIQKLIAQMPKLDPFKLALLSEKTSRIAEDINKKLSEQVAKPFNLSSADKI